MHVAVSWGALPNSTLLTPYSPGFRNHPTAVEKNLAGKSNGVILM